MSASPHNRRRLVLAESELAARRRRDIYTQRALVEPNLRARIIIIKLHVDQGILIKIAAWRCERRRCIMQISSRNNSWGSEFAPKPDFSPSHAARKLLFWACAAKIIRKIAPIINIAIKLTGFTARRLRYAITGGKKNTKKKEKKIENFVVIEISLNNVKTMK